MNQTPPPAAPDQPLSRLEHGLLPLAGRLIPKSKRLDWLREWQAELWHLQHESSLRAHRSHTPLATLSLAWGLLADALWVGTHALKEEKEGSAAWCLYQLAASCLACALVEYLYIGSFHNLGRTFAGYFIGRFMLIALPAIFVALATMPNRPRRCNLGPADAIHALTAKTRWTLFLSTKVALSVTLGFLLAVLISIPARRALGHNSDWIDIMTSTLMLTCSLRLSLDDQKQRCHRCLRLLRQPVRVGPPSHNLLNWNGTEMACSDGHGLLQVPEMQGSWCWYDLWIEVDPKWQHYPIA